MSVLVLEYQTRSYRYISNTSMWNRLYWQGSWCWPASWPFSELPIMTRPGGPWEDWRETWLLETSGSEGCRERRVAAFKPEGGTATWPHALGYLCMFRNGFCIQAQSNDLSMRPPCAPCPHPASDNIYSKSIALTIKSEAASSDRFNGVLTGRELIMMQTLTCLLICFLFPSSSLTPSFSRRRNLGISNQVTASPLLFPAMSSCLNSLR